MLEEIEADLATVDEGGWAGGGAVALAWLRSPSRFAPGEVPEQSNGAVWKCAGRRPGLFRYVFASVDPRGSPAIWAPGDPLHPELC